MTFEDLKWRIGQISTKDQNILEEFIFWHLGIRVKNLALNYLGSKNFQVVAISREELEWNSKTILGKFPFNQFLTNKR
jgi:hypothetical protein